MILCRLLFLQLCLLVTSKDTQKEKNNTFIPTKEWQPVLEGQQIPAGLHVRINLQTGKKEAKLIQDDSENALSTLPDSGSENVKNDVKPNTSIPVSKKLEEAFKKIPLDKVETTDPENIKDLKTKYKSYKEIKKEFKDINMNIQSDFEILGDLTNEFVIVTKAEKNVLRILDDLNYLAHQIDNALWFIDKGVLDLVVLPGIVNQTNINVRIKSLRLLGALTQNNPRAQIATFEKNFGTYLSQILITATNAEELSTGIYAFGSLLRKFPHVQKEILSKSGTTALTTMLLRDIDLRIKIKALTLISDLLLDKEYAVNMELEHVNPKKAEQYKEILLETWLLDARFCEAVHNFLLQSKNEILNNINLIDYLIQALQSFKNVCFKNWSKNVVFKNTLLIIKNHFEFQHHDEEYLVEIFQQINDLFRHLYGDDKINDEF